MIEDLTIVPRRRAFMQTAGLAGLAGLAMFASPEMVGSAMAVPAGPLSDFDILNFALNLEYLEAEFYTRAAFGRGLFPNETSGSGTQGTVTGGRQVQFQSNVIQQYAQEIASDEENHVNFLRKTITALGGTPVAEPTINVGTAFAALGQAAGLGPFDPYVNDTTFLIGAFIFEDVGVTAYKGAARFIQNKDVLEAAAGLLAVEAYHASEVRTLLAGMGQQAAAQAISNLRNSVDLNGHDDQGITLNGALNIVPTDANSLAFSRTPQQVLNIVYGNAQGKPGTFFPNGTNGKLH